MENNLLFKITTNATDEQTKSIIEQYWDFDTVSKKFIYSIAEISIKHNLAKHLISQKVKESSICVFPHFYQCKTCKNHFAKAVYPRTDFTRVFNMAMNPSLKNIAVCSHCKNAETAALKAMLKKQEEEYEREMQLLQEKANSVLQLCPNNTTLYKNEMAMLTKIVQAQGKKDAVYRTAFGGNAFDKEHWKSVRALEALGLVECVRNTITGKVMGFNFIPELSDIFECEKPPGIYKDPGTTQEGESSSLNLELYRSKYVDYPGFPDFSGIFELKERLVLQPGTKLVYAAWTNDDGDMYFKIEPYHTISQKSTVYNDPLDKNIITLSTEVRDFLDRAKPVEVSNNDDDDGCPL